MKRAYWMAAAMALTAWGVAGSLGGCGDDDATAISGADGGNDTATGGTSGATSGASSGSSSSSGGSSGLVEGGADTGALPASNPGQVTCGAGACDAGTRCCVPSGDAGGAPSCQNDCPNGDVELRCDEKADCQGQNRCCGDDNGSTQCDNNCPGNAAEEIRVCKSAAECGDGGACTVRTCTRGNGDRARTFTLRVCGTPEGCN